MAVDGKVFRLADYLEGRGSNFTLPVNARARIDCGAMSFRLDHTTRAKVIPKRWFAWQWEVQKFMLGSFLAMGLFLLMIFVVPPDGMTVSGGLLSMNTNFIPFIVKAPEPEQVPEILTQRPDNNPSDSGKARAGESGRPGDRNSKRTTGAPPMKGDGKEMNRGKSDAVAAVLETGILSVLRSAQGAQFKDIFGRGSAVGTAQESILTGLEGDQFANAYSAGGWNVRGSGNGGGGTNGKTIGAGGFNTVDGKDYGRGPGVGSLTRHIARPPSIITGVITTKGSLDKEIIRRVVHLHMNEVKYCYDQELSRKADLAGRISVQFVISPMGQVISSVLQSTTMNNLRVESCVVGAVKRWPFPKPNGGGIAIVSYPFNFVAGSGG